MSKKPTYLRPEVKTVPAAEILEALGPVAAGSFADTSAIDSGSVCQDKYPDLANYCPR